MTDVPKATVPAVVDPTPASEAKPPKENRPAHGPGSKVNWDNPKNAPAKRKTTAEDPTGRENLKLL